jgi:predicted nuclease with TOPRIM domain
MNKTTVSLAVIAALAGCAIAVWANTKTARIHQHLDQERYMRLDTERKFQESLTMLKNLKGELIYSTGEVERMKAIIDQGEAKSQQLKAEITHMTQLNTHLKARIDDLETALQENTGLKAKMNPLENPQAFGETPVTVD